MQQQQKKVGKFQFQSGTIKAKPDGTLKIPKMVVSIPIWYD